MNEMKVLNKLPWANVAQVRLYFGFLMLFSCSLSCSIYGQTLTPPTVSGAEATSVSQPAHDHSSHVVRPLKTNKLLSTREVTSIVIPDITMTDQNSRRVRLYDGLMKNKLVVLNYFYTKCEGICPTSGYWLSKLQHKLGPRLGKEIVIVSITIDPEVDTAKKINQWGVTWKRRRGWTLLTSRDKAVSDMMSKFTPYPSKGVHSPTVFVGDGRQNPVEWIAVDLLDEGSALLDYFQKLKSNR